MREGGRAVTPRPSPFSVVHKREEEEQGGREHAHHTPHLERERPPPLLLRPAHHTRHLRDGRDARSKWKGLVVVGALLLEGSIEREN